MAPSALFRWEEVVVVVVEVAILQRRRRPLERRPLGRLE